MTEGNPSDSDDLSYLTTFEPSKSTLMKPKGNLVYFQNLCKLYEEDSKTSIFERLERLLKNDVICEVDQLKISSQMMFVFVSVLTLFKMYLFCITKLM